MDDDTDKKTPRRKPGAPFFLAAMAFYLLLVHGCSLLAFPAGSVQAAPAYYPATWPWFNAFLDILGGGSALRCALLAIPLLYAGMVLTFFLTRALVPGPVWLGSLAGTFLMAHPAKTEVLFSPLGLYYMLATVAALAAILAYVRLRLRGGWGRLFMATLLFASASVPFTVNAFLLSIIILVEFMAGDAEDRNWLRPIPLVLITMLANWFHLDTVYTVLPTPSMMYSPLLLLAYPIGLLPETVAGLEASPWEAWVWGALSFAGAAVLFVRVKSKPLRFVLLSILFLRFYPGALPVDYVTMEGGGQLFLPIALTGIGLAALSAWLMGHDAWGQSTVSLTTILCLVLFILQFQANRAYLHRLGDGPVLPNAVEAPMYRDPGGSEVSS